MDHYERRCNGSPSALIVLSSFFCLLALTDPFRVPAAAEPTS